jgi:hypothetical protein
MLRNCPGCGSIPGNKHSINACDVERCSSCGGQRFSCCCGGKNDRAFSRWTGFWPGELESNALGIDLNTFHIKGYNKIFFIKPN